MLIQAEQIQANGPIQFNNEFHFHQSSSGLQPAFDEPNDLLPQFEAAKEYVELRDPKAAMAILSKVEIENGHRFTDHTRFRFLATRGQALELLGDREAAARCFLNAKQFRPNSEAATSLEILAHISLGHDERAFELASQARRKFSESVHIAGLWAQCAPLSNTLGQIESEIPKHLQSDASVAMGLATAAGKRGDLHAAAVYAKAAVEKAPDWVEAKSLSATLIIDLSEPSSATSELATACAALRECIEKTHSQGNLVEVVRLYLNLNVGYKKLGDIHAAHEAIAAAYRLAPKNEQVRLSRAISFLDQGKHNDAIAVLDDGIELQPFPAQLIWAQMRAQRGAPGDHDLAANLLEMHYGKLGEDNHKLSASWIDTLVKLYLHRQDFGTAVELLNGELARTTLTKIGRLVLLATAERLRGNAGDAHQLARQIIEHLQSSDNKDAEAAAALLENFDEVALALQAWKKAVAPSSPLPTLRHVMSLSMERHDDEYALHLGRECRAAGIFDRALIEMELAVLQRISSTRCEQLISETLLAFPDGALSRYLRMRRTLLGASLNREDLIERDVAQHPKFDEIDEYLCQPAVDALSWADPTRGVELAYSLLRQYPDSVNAHWAMIASLMPSSPGKQQPVIPQPAAVDLDSAVRLEDLPGKVFHWHVIHDQTDVKSSLNEVSSQGAIARAVLGKVVGDEVDIAEAFGSKRRARISEILHKWIFRFRDCIEQFAARFPEQPFLKKFDVDKKAAPPDAFRELLAFMVEAQTRHTDLLKLYEDTPAWPLTLLAKGIQKPIILTMAEIIATEGARLRATIAPPGTQDDHQRPLSSYRELVLETTALGTMFLLDQSVDLAIFAEMEKWPYHCLISEKSVEELDWLLDELSSANARIGAESIAGSVVPRITSAEETERWSCRLRPKAERLIAAIRSNCEIVPGSTLPDIPVEYRDTIADVLGRAGAESLQIAKSRGALLWTDDAVISQIGGREIGCRCTSTQAICRAVLVKDSPLLFRQISLGLLALKYDIIEFTIDDALAAASQVNWNVRAMPFAAVLDCFANPGIPSQSLFALGWGLLSAVWSNSLLESHAVQLTQRILDRIGKRPDGRSMVNALYQNATAICSLQLGSPVIITAHFIAAENLRRIILNWISFNQAGNIIRPEGN